MSPKRMGLGAMLLAFVVGLSSNAYAMPKDWGIDFQEAASPVMAQIEDFHRLLLYIIVLISLFVLVLMLWTFVRYNARANPTPSKVHHNTILEVA